MEQIIHYLRQKSQLIYDINCIQKYIEGGDYDQNLKKAWDGYKQELKNVEQKINEIRKPQLIEFENKKLEILSKIKEYDNKIRKLKQQLKDLDKIILELK